jgi:hypothetical protein
VDVEGSGEEDRDEGRQPAVRTDNARSIALGFGSLGGNGELLRLLESEWRDLGVWTGELALELFTLSEETFPNQKGRRMGVTGIVINE